MHVKSRLSPSLVKPSGYVTTILTSGLSVNKKTTMIRCHGSFSSSCSTCSRRSRGKLLLDSTVTGWAISKWKQNSQEWIPGSCRLIWLSYVHSGRPVALQYLRATEKEVLLLSMPAKDCQNVKEFQSSFLFFPERSDKTVVYLEKINILPRLRRGTLTFLWCLTV